MFFQKPFSKKQRGMELDYDKIIDFSVRKKKSVCSHYFKEQRMKRRPLFWKAFVRIVLILKQKPCVRLPDNSDSQH